MAKEGGVNAEQQLSVPIEVLLDRGEEGALCYLQAQQRWSEQVAGSAYSHDSARTCLDARGLPRRVALLKAQTVRLSKVLEAVAAYKLVRD